jgi:hypothetical protein
MEPMMIINQHLLWIACEWGCQSTYTKVEIDVDANIIYIHGYNNVMIIYKANKWFIINLVVTYLSDNVNNEKLDNWMIINNNWDLYYLYGFDLQ